MGKGFARQSQLRMGDSKFQSPEWNCVFWLLYCACVVWMGNKTRPQTWAQRWSTIEAELRKSIGGDVVFSRESDQNKVYFTMTLPADVDEVNINSLRELPQDVEIVSKCESVPTNRYILLVLSKKKFVHQWRSTFWCCAFVCFILKLQW